MRFPPLPDVSVTHHQSPQESCANPVANASRYHGSTSFRALWDLVVRRRKLISSVEGGLLALCLLYCLVAPKQYEATAKVALRTASASPLSLESPEQATPASLLSSPMVLETLANVFRSDQLAWRVIGGLKLYDSSAFNGDFARRFPSFRPDAPGADAQAWLLERFQKRLSVQTLPRTLLIQIRFRSRDATLSAAVVNALIRAYGQQDSESRVQATVQASGLLETQLQKLKAGMDRDQQHLKAFQIDHGILASPEMFSNGQAGEVQHASVLLEIDELGRQLVVATTDRILREAEFQVASQGDPELVIASDPRLQAESSSFATALLQQIHTQSSNLQQEQAQLSAEHGPNFPRVVEIRNQMQDLERQRRAEDDKLVARFQSAWQTAVDREQMVRKRLDQRTAEGMKMNQASDEYAEMRQEANSSHELYMKVQEKIKETGLYAGLGNSSITVVDCARQPAKAVAPDLPLYLAITFFAGLWLAVGGALLLDSLSVSKTRVVAPLLVIFLVGTWAQGQAPTPSTSGLPTGVARLPFSQETRNQPNPKEAPAVWNSPVVASQTGKPPLATAPSETPMAALIGPGDFLDISEFHTPEFHSAARVSAAGTIVLPMINEVLVGGLDEPAAARAIEAALIAKGMLLHPQIHLLVTAYVGQDVSVLGEVAHPGVYPYALHHRLLDLVSVASGLAPNAGRLVNVFHRSDPQTPHSVVLDPSGTDAGSDHNPELSPGDTVQVSRAGLVFVVGDVIRPGGFPVDPVQGLTVVQALSLAWGPSQNAATGSALLIREQKGGRTLTALNLKRMLHGQDPDQPIHDRDILFVPNSTAKNLWNRAVESAIQSAIGVTIYSGLVYSQRY